MNIICVDDEQPVLENFRMKVKNLPEVESLQLFSDGEQAMQWARANPVDVAFLDMEMSGMHGLQLARELKTLDSNVRVVFVTAYEKYALDAFGVDAIGYVLKPYSSEDISKELRKAARIRPIPKRKIQIRTMPTFTVMVDGQPLRMKGSKPEELLALLVDHGEAGVSAREAISCLWPDRPSDDGAQGLYRVTFHRMMEELKEAGVDDIIESYGRKKYIVQNQVECDLYRMLDDNMEEIRNYGGEYLKDYSWAEMRNAQLNSLKRRKIKEDEA